MANQTENTVKPNEFTIVSSGAKSDGKTFWSQIQKEDSGFIQRAFIVTTTAQEAGKSLVIPTQLLKGINWQF